MNMVLVDDASREDLLPFTYTRPLGAIRFGILTAEERWKHISGGAVSFQTEAYLQEKFPLQETGENIYVLGSVLPDPVLAQEILGLKSGQALHWNRQVVAWSGPAGANASNGMEMIQSQSNGSVMFSRLWHLFSLNDAAIRLDFQWLTQGRTSAAIPAGNQCIQPEHIFIEPGAQVQGAFLNASTGPIYIGKDAEVMEGTLIRGPFALCEHASTKMATKIYGATTIGPHCKVGGEISNIIMFGYSNKGHDGFLGNAVIGEWCNLGADTNCSNLKNNYAEIKLWSHRQKKFERTGLTFCGLMMADHAKCGINTMFNTATVVGVAANIFGAGFPRTFVPAFSWGGAHGFETFQLPKVNEMAEAMCSRRKIAFTETDRKLLQHIFDMTQDQRS